MFGSSPLIYSSLSAKIRVHLSHLSSESLLTFWSSVLAVHNLWKHNNFVDYLTFFPSIYDEGHLWSFSIPYLEVESPLFFFSVFMLKLIQIAVDLILGWSLCLELAAYQGLEEPYFSGLYYSISLNIQSDLFFSLFWALFFQLISAK